MRIYPLIVLGAAASLAPAGAAAVNSSWTGAVSSAWNTAGNWSNGVPNNAGRQYLHRDDRCHRCRGGIRAAFYHQQLAAACRQPRYLGELAFHRHRGPGHCRLAQCQLRQPFRLRPPGRAGEQCPVRRGVHRLRLRLVARKPCLGGSGHPHHRSEGQPFPEWREFVHPGQHHRPERPAQSLPGGRPAVDSRQEPRPLWQLLEHGRPLRLRIVRSGGHHHLRRPRAAVRRHPCGGHVFAEFVRGACEHDFLAGRRCPHDRQRRGGGPHGRGGLPAG